MLTSHLIIFPLLSLMPILLVTLNKSHLLMTLLYFESLTLVLISNLYMFIISHAPQQSFMMLLMLTLSACEASLGLACLVKMMRSYGNDNISNLSLIKC